MSNNHELDTSEILQRARRIETRLWKLCERLGVLDPPTEAFPVDPAKGNKRARIHMPGMDVPLSKVKRELSIAGVDPYEGEVILVVNGVSVAVVSFLRED